MLPQAIPLMRQILIALGILLAAVALRFGYVQFNKAARPEPPSTASAPAATPPEYLSPHLRILMFYQTDPAVPLGRPMTVCYGVVNAISLKLDPPLAQVAPSINDCFAVTAGRAQLLTLTATGKDGEHAVAAFRLGSRHPRATFTSLQLSTLTPKRGETITLCYGTNSAESVRLLPEGPPLRPSARQCVEFAALSESYRLVAESEHGRDEVPLPMKYKE